MVTRPDGSFAALVVEWYATQARDLPWRGPQVAPWGVLVSEVMLQQTPVARVQPVYVEWMRRWPTPAALASATAGDAVRAWGRLGYPRRALRLHQSAVRIERRHGGQVPADLDALLALPGVGAYTARAVATFAFGQRHAVVDTNVRRVVARAVGGTGNAPPSARADLRAVEPLLPDDPSAAATLSAALMELGATVCTARAPGCERCPVQAACAWRAAGCPTVGAQSRRAQPWAGTDRQARGRLLQVLRDSTGPVTTADLDAAWPAPAQRDRALASLIVDGLAETVPGGGYALPTTPGDGRGGHPGG